MSKTLFWNKAEISHSCDSNFNTNTSLKIPANIDDRPCTIHILPVFGGWSNASLTVWTCFEDKESEYRTIFGELADSNIKIFVLHEAGKFFGKDILWLADTLDRMHLINSRLFEAEMESDEK